MKLKSVYTAVVILVLLFGCSKNAVEVKVMDILYTSPQLEQ